MAKYSNRVKEFVKGVKLPSVFTPENRGLDECCEPFKVFASSDTDRFKNDKTSAWMRDVDSIAFKLVKSDSTEITINEVPFINQLNAYYCTVIWRDILVNYGQGCYDLIIDYSIAGISDSLTWGSYFLQEYSEEKVRGLVSVRSFFNSIQTIEGIDFSGSKVEDCINFYGFFGNRQPRTEIDNLVYSNRESRKVKRENLNQYDLSADAVSECISKKLLDLHLLSENDLFVTDHNTLNHSYRYIDFPVIVEESAEVSYNGRKATLSCKLGDKFKNSISKYGI